MTKTISDRRIFLKKQISILEWDMKNITNDDVKKSKAHTLMELKKEFEEKYGGE